MDVTPQPVESTFTTSMATRIPIVHDIVHRRLRRALIHYVFGLLTQIKSTQLRTRYSIRTHVRIQIHACL